MPRAGALRPLSLGLLLTAATGMAGCVLAPHPGPVVVGPPVVIAPRPVIVAPRPRPFYRGGYRGHHHRGHRHYWR